MAEDYTFMDDWTDEEVADFKEEAREKEISLEGASGGMETAFPAEKIVAEGDSWFDYLPGTDIIDCLRSHYNYVIRNYAKAGDTLENMIYGTEIDSYFDRISPTIERVLKKIKALQPKVFLFSGGGNDIAGEEFASFLNHKSSGLPPLREDYVDTMVNTVFRKYFEDLISRVEAVSPATYIVTHGYGHTIPTGKGVTFLIFTFVGPWIRPALAKKGIFDKAEQRETVARMIDAYNNMLHQLAESNDSFIYVDLRHEIDPEDDWVNELHLKNSAYARVTDKIHKAISEL
jgi:lysophospholipase L1-like esterase